MKVVLEFDTTTKAAAATADGAPVADLESVHLYRHWAPAGVQPTYSLELTTAKYDPVDGTSTLNRTCAADAGFTPMPDPTLVPPELAAAAKAGLGLPPC